MKLLDYSGLQRFLSKIKTLLDSKSNTGHTHVTSEVTDLLNSQHTWSAQQSYSADLNLNYSSTDVDDILDTVAGSYTAEDFLAQNNVWTGDNTFTANVSLQGGIYAQNYYLGTTAFGDIVTHNASEFLTSHQSLSNYVTLDGAQTISGNKTFTGTLTGTLTGNCSGSSGSCTGNAATATQFSANKSVTLTGDVTGTASSKAGWSVATTLANSGVTAGTYGPSADVTGNNNATISVPEITVDAKGRVTSVTNRTLTCKNNTYSVYNKTLTIQKNGTNVATFTSNSNTDVTANITVPTKVSELTNDSGFLTSHQSLSNYVTLNSDQTISGIKTLIDWWRLQAKNLKAGEGETYGRTGYSVIYTDKDGVEMGDVTLFKNANAARSYLRLRGGDYYTNGAPAAAGTLVQSDLRIGTLANGTRMIECYTDAFYPVDTNTTGLGTSANQWKSVYAQTYYYNGTAWGLDKANRFTACQTISGSNVGGENTTNYRTVMALQSNRDTNGKSCMYITKFRQNKAQGSMGADDLAQIAIDVLENEVRTNNLFCFGARGFSSDAPSIAIFSSGATGSSNLGTSAVPWTNTYTTNLTVSGTGVCTTPAVSDNSGKIATTAFVRSAIPYIISGGANTSAGNITLFQGTIISGFAESSSVTYSTAFGGILTSPSHLYYATCIYNTSDSTMSFSKGPAVGGTGTWKLMGGGSSNPGTSTKLLFGLWVKIA